ncbi:MAG: sensor histidine kinase [Bacteroidetes bacterium]|nr:MAG: sensor histidine kinase [Bacteroidota bacterium]
MKIDLTFTLLLSLSLSFSTHAQESFDQRQLDVYFHPQQWVADTSMSNFEDGYLKSLANYLIGDFDLSERILKRAAVNDSTVTPSLQVYRYLLLCKIYRSKGQYVFSLDMLSEALSIATEEGDPQLLSKVYVEYMEQLRATHQYDEALNYVPLLQELEPEMNPETRIRFWHRYAAVLLEMGNHEYEKSDELLQKAIRWSDSLNLPWHSAAANLDYGYVHYNNRVNGKYYLDPMQYFRKSYRLNDQLGHLVDRTSALHNMARYYLLDEKYDSADYCLLKMLRPAVKHNWVSVQANVWDSRGVVFEAQGDYDSALFAIRKYHDLKMLEYRDNNSNLIAEMSAKLGAVSARNALLESENQRFQTSQLLTKESRMKKIFIGMNILLITLIAIIIYLFLQQKKNLKKLTEQGVQIERTNNRLTKTLEQKDMIYRELHHRVKNNLANLSGLIYLQERSLASEEAKSALMETRNRIQAMSVIHEGLYQTDDIVQIQLQSYFEDLLMRLLSVYEDEKLRIDWVVDCEEMTLSIESALPLAMIINELLTNSLKYAFKENRKGVLRIEGSMDEVGNWWVSVTDDGPGIPSTFDLAANKTLGMSLVQILSEDIGASFEYVYENQLSRSIVRYNGNDVR